MLMFTSPSQVFVTVFGFNIYYYGVILAVAITLGILISEKISRKYFKQKKDVIIDLAPYLIFFGLVGARLYYCFLNCEFYVRFPSEIFAIRHGGISIHGAIFGGIFGVWLYSLRHKISFYKLCDICSIGLVIGQAIGRWGNFFNSEAYGYPTDLPWKLYVSPQYRVIPYTDYEYYHPTFLYESLLDVLVFFVLYKIVKSKSVKAEGNIALFYLIMYSIVRIFVEFFRIDSAAYIMGVPVAIFVSAAIIIVSLILMYLNKNNKELE